MLESRGFLSFYPQCLPRGGQRKKSSLFLLGGVLLVFTNFHLIHEVVRFFDFHLKGIKNGIGNEPPVHFFTMGKETWESSKQWPPDDISTYVLHLDENNKLNGSSPVSKTSYDTYTVDFKASVGKVSRWDSLINSVDRPDRRDRHVEYPNRAQEDQRLQVYESEPLSGDLQLTGHPVARHPRLLIHRLCPIIHATEMTLCRSRKEKWPDLT